MTRSPRATARPESQQSEVSAHSTRSSHLLVARGPAVPRLSRPGRRVVQSCQRPLSTGDGRRSASTADLRHCSRVTRTHPDVQTWPRRLASHLELTSGVVTTAQANQLGVSPRQLRRLVASRQLTRVGAGVYLDSARLRTQFEEQAHAARAKALASTRHDLALSHHSAAAVLGLPWVGALPTRVHLTRRPGPAPAQQTRHGPPGIPRRAVRAGAGSANGRGGSGDARCC